MSLSMILLLTGTSMLACCVGIIAMFVLYGRRFRKGNRRRKKSLGSRGGLQVLERSASDDISAYWGSCMPKGVNYEGSQLKGKSEVCVEPVVAGKVEVKEVEEVKKPVRILGDGGMSLGERYFQYLLKEDLLPRGRLSMTSSSNLIIAQNALRSKLPSAILSHGAVVQRIGESSLCLFEPLEQSVQHVDKALESMSELFKGRICFIVMADVTGVEQEKLSHIGKISKAFGLSESHIFIEQPSGLFANYVEHRNDFVAERINVDVMPSDFFASMLDYAHAAFDEGDVEAVLRCINPMLDVLVHRSQVGDFPKVLCSQALNLVGMSNRSLKRDEASIACFSTALELLKQAEDYESVKVVEANLGITLALSASKDMQRLLQASKHLQHVTDLNPEDREAWLYLADTYLQQYKQSRSTSLLSRAYRAYEQANELRSSASLQRCLNELGEKQKLMRASAIRREAYGVGEASQGEEYENVLASYRSPVEFIVED